MANAKRCDRCGRFYTTQNDIKVHFVTEPYVKANHLQLEYTSKLERKRVDLCPECVDELIQYFNECWEEQIGEHLAG